MRKPLSQKYLFAISDHHFRLLIKCYIYSQVNGDFKSFWHSEANREIPPSVKKHTQKNEEDGGGG